MFSYVGCVPPSPLLQPFSDDASTAADDPPTFALVLAGRKRPLRRPTPPHPSPTSPSSSSRRFSRRRRFDRKRPKQRPSSPRCCSRPPSSSWTACALPPSVPALSSAGSAADLSCSPRPVQPVHAKEAQARRRAARQGRGPARVYRAARAGPCALARALRRRAPKLTPLPSAACRPLAKSTLSCPRMPQRRPRTTSRRSRTCSRARRPRSSCSSASSCSRRRCGLPCVCPSPQ